MNVPRCRYGLLLGISILAVSGFLRAIQAPFPGEPQDAWLRAPDHHDFEWKVQVVGPWLSFQQRYVAGVQAALPIRKMVRAGVSLSDLHFRVKVGDKDGNWFPGQFETVFVPPPDVAKGKELFFYARFFVRPGSYRIAVLVYDGRTRLSNVWKDSLEAPLLKTDPLPNLDRDLPAVQFESEKDREPFSSARSRLVLPVNTQHRVQLDVVVNLSLSDAMNTRYHQAPDWLYRTNAGMLLQIGRVLSQLELKDGCVRFSAIDILRQKVFADRVRGNEADWNELARSIEKLQRNRIDAHVLQQQKTTPALFAHFLEDTAADPPSCGNPGAPPARVVVVVSDAFLFPFKTEMASVLPERMRGVQCYFLQLNPVRGGTWDQMGRVLRPLHPKHWEFSNATRFRKVLAELVADIEHQADATNPRLDLQ